MAKLFVVLVVATSTFLFAFGGRTFAGRDGELPPLEFGVAARGGAGTAAMLTHTTNITPPVGAGIGEGVQPESIALQTPVSQTTADLISNADNPEIAPRKFIPVASVSLEVEAVETAVTQVRLIAVSLGGFVEQLSSTGDAERRQAHITIYVPQVHFLTALERIEDFGNVRDWMVGSGDVEARLKSFLQEEQSLLSLLEKTETVSEILSVELELPRVRSEIERLEGQLNFLEQQLATIRVNLFPSKEQVTEPPSASLTIKVADVTGSVNEVKDLVSALGGVVDGISLSPGDEKKQADLSLRVFTPNFGEALVLSQLGFGNCLRKRLRLLPFFRSVDVGGWQPWDENGMWSGWKGKNETSWND